MKGCLVDGRYACMPVLEEAGGRDEGEKQAGGGDAIAGKPAAAGIFPKLVHHPLPGRFPVIQALARNAVRAFQLAAPG